MSSQHKQSAPRAGEGPPVGAARLGRTALQKLLLELQGALVDVEGSLSAGLKAAVRSALTATVFLWAHNT